MQTELTVQLVGLVERSTLALEQIAQALAAQVTAVQRPQEYELPLKEYPTFDWSSVGATVKQSDNNGPMLLECRGLLWVRRCKPQCNKSIWFSREIAEGEVKSSQTLITFKDIEPEALPDNIANVLQASCVNGQASIASSTAMGTYRQQLKEATCERQVDDAVATLQSSPEWPTLLETPALVAQLQAHEREVRKHICQQQSSGFLTLVTVRAQIDVELVRLRWDATTGTRYLQATYGKKSRRQLTDEELLNFLVYLKGQPTPGVEPAS
ncbi:single-stranded DNA-binding protein [Leptolyngbya sp. FACHB-261]|uniref:single-stranded DNA-binding protein n=1 Tax=Leptolyngbya sp. FACHB-261 TaxID=2692806 RepID=UPI001682EF44|nr:single-stranded DNA-binding protein [Leptolyngbya sp. FACHB-261]MBD2105177.1 hypothetical protein [Leptolyngbya sp. FACHB-261]